MQQIPDHISSEDLNLVKLLQQEIIISRLNTEKLELRLNNFTLQLYVKYGLSVNYSINSEDGSIQLKINPEEKNTDVQPEK